MSASKWKPYPKSKHVGYKWLESIPGNWNMCRLKHYTYIKGRIGWHGLKSDDFIEEGPFLVTGSDFVDGKVDWSNCYHVSMEKYDMDPYIQLQEGDLLITKDGTIGKLAIVRDLPGLATLNSGVFVLRPNRGKYDSEFMYYILQSDLFHGFNDYNKYGSTIDHLYQHTFGNMPFTAPTLIEQKKIVKVLRNNLISIDKILRKAKKILELLEENRSNLIAQAVSKGLNSDVPMKYSEIQWIGEIPQHWNSKKLKFVSKIFRGKFGHRPRNDPKLYDGEYPFVQTGNVARADKYLTKYQQTLNELGRSVSEEFPSGTIVMAIAANIGDVAILTFDACFPDSIVGFKPKENMNREFVYYALKALASELDKVASQSTQQNLNIELVGNLTIPVPPLEEQIMISDFISELEKNTGRSIQKMQKKVSRLEEYRTALISAAVTGKIDLGEF